MPVSQIEELMLGIMQILNVLFVFDVYNKTDKPAMEE